MIETVSVTVGSLGFVNNVQTSGIDKTDLVIECDIFTNKETKGKTYTDWVAYLESRVPNFELHSAITIPEGTLVTYTRNVDPVLGDAQKVFAQMQIPR